MTNLYISLYPEKNHNRRKELQECLKLNLRIFDRVFILMEGVFEFDYQFEMGSAIVLPVTERPTFKTFFGAIVNTSNTADTNVISNADIYFDKFTHTPNDNQCFAVTRYEDGVLLNRNDSQDVWIFKGHVKGVKYCSFHLGTPGCDNRIAWELRAAGYEVINPALTIKTHHLHKGEKSYTSTASRVGTPYLKLNDRYL